MANPIGNDQDDLVTGINVTPLVDVVLVLLVIFLMTAPVLYQSAIKVQLPQAKSGESSQKSALEFTITKDSKLLWGQKEISWNDLSAQLKAMGAKINEETAIIQADQATPHGEVIRLMDILRQAGLVRFAMSVDKK